MLVASSKIGCLLSGTLALGILVAPVLSPAASAQVLERIKSSGRIKLGYPTDARPFAFQADGGGAPQGYSATLCTVVADQVKQALGIADFTVEWTPIPMGEGVEAIRSGKVDLLCGADHVTLTAREQVSFSIPIFPSGTGALLRTDAPLALREVLEHGRPSDRPVWRGSPARTVLQRKTFAAVTGTTSTEWLQERVNALQIDATVRPVESYSEGVDRVLDGSADALFGDLPILLDFAARSPDSGRLMVLNRHFTYEPLALALNRDDADFRLEVDRALSHFYRSEGFREFFTEWFGPPEERMVTFIQQTALPD